MHCATKTLKYGYMSYLNKNHWLDFDSHFKNLPGNNTFKTAWESVKSTYRTSHETEYTGLCLPAWTHWCACTRTVGTHARTHARTHAHTHTHIFKAASQGCVFGSHVVDHYGAAYYNGLRVTLTQKIHMPGFGLVCADATMVTKQ